MVFDIVAGVALVYFSNGLTSPFILALFLAILASAVRFGFGFIPRSDWRRPGGCSSS
jgi:hypothetical protein